MKIVPQNNPPLNPSPLLQHVTQETELFSHYSTLITSQPSI